MKNDERINRSIGVVFLISLTGLMIILLGDECKKPGFTILGFAFALIIIVAATALIYQLSKLFGNNTPTL